MSPDTNHTTANPTLRLRVADALTQQLNGARQLLETLAAEHQALLASDVGTLEQLTASKAGAAQQLEALGATLLRLRSATGSRDIDELLAGADPSGTTAARWRELIDLAAQCQDANRANAALLEARQTQIRAALRVLSEQAGGNTTYGRGGSAASGFAPRSLGSA